jgi:hypothetical protein
MIRTKTIETRKRIITKSLFDMPKTKNNSVLYYGADLRNEIDKVKQDIETLKDFINNKQEQMNGSAFADDKYRLSLIGYGPFTELPLDKNQFNTVATMLYDSRVKTLKELQKMYNAL